MDFETPSSSSSSSENFAAATDRSMINASTQKKRAGQRKMRHPVYRGVRRRDSGNWVSEVRDPNKKSRIWLGTFPNPEMAAVAHDVAARALHGDDAPPLNFPDSAHRLPRPASLSHRDIKRAAVQAARHFPPAMAFWQNASENGVSLESSSSSSNSSNAKDDGGKKKVETCSNGGGVEFEDEEAIFNIPLLLDSMAEGMLLTPLAMKRGFNWSQEVDDDIDLCTLWGD